jgi:hypothetical protein
VKKLQAAGANVMMPLQKGKISMANFDRKVEGLFGSDYIRAIPMKKDATTVEELEGFLKDRKPARVHLLGLGVKQEAKLKAIVDMAKRVSPGTKITADSVRITAAAGRGGGRRRKLTASQDRARRRQRERAFAEHFEGGDWTDEGHEPEGWTSKADRQRIAKNAGLDAKQTKAFAKDPNAFLQTEVHPGMKWYEHPALTSALEGAWLRYQTGEFETSKGKTRLRGAGEATRGMPHEAITRKKREAIEEAFGEGETTRKPLATVEKDARSKLAAAKKKGSMFQVGSALIRLHEVQIDHAADLLDAVKRGEVKKKEWDSVHKNVYGTFDDFKNLRPRDLEAPIERSNDWKRYVRMEKSATVFTEADALRTFGVNKNPPRPQIVQGADNVPYPERRAPTLINEELADELGLTPEGKKKRKKKKKTDAAIQTANAERNRARFESMRYPQQPHGQDGEVATAKGYIPEDMKTGFEAARTDWEHNREKLDREVERRMEARLDDGGTNKHFRTRNAQHREDREAEA